MRDERNGEVTGVERSEVDDELLTSPISPHSGPAQWLFQGPHAESKFLAAKQIPSIHSGKIISS